MLSSAPADFGSALTTIGYGADNDQCLMVPDVEESNLNDEDTFLGGNLYQTNELMNFD